LRSSLTRSFAPPHGNLGNVYEDEHKLDDAIAEYKIAILLDPKIALLHNDLGFAYSNEDKREMAIAEYQKATELDPKNALLPQNNLGLLVETVVTSSGTDEQKAKWLEDICQVFALGSKLAPDDPAYTGYMHRIDTLMKGNGHCPPT
jgi:tetratricopeptide (TPR) repeat protein